MHRGAQGDGAVVLKYIGLIIRLGLSMALPVLLGILAGKKLHKIAQNNYTKGIISGGSNQPAFFNLRNSLWKIHIHADKYYINKKRILM